MTWSDEQSGRVGQMHASEGRPLSKGLVGWCPTLLPVDRSSGSRDWRSETPGWVWEGKAFPNCVTPSQAIQEATSWAKLKLTADSLPGLLPEVGEFRTEAAG